MSPGWALALALLVVGPALADEPPEKLSEAEVVERVLELQRQIDELIASLPPETQEAVRQRLAESAAAVPEMREAPVPPDLLPPAVAQAAPPATVAAPPADVAPPPVAPPVGPPPSEPLRRKRVSRPHCNFLDFLDSNQDGRLSAHDRYWRHLNLWTDANGDRQAQDGEVTSTWESDVREIAVDLDTFVRKKGILGEIRVDRYLTLDVRGDGFGSGDDAVLVVDATRLKRGTGPEVLSAAGESLEGFQPFQEGWRIKDESGQEIVLTCP